MSAEAIAIKLAAWYVIGGAVLWGVIALVFIVAVIVEIIRAVKEAKNEHRRKEQ